MGRSRGVKVFSFMVFLLLFVSMIPFVFAQELVPTIPKPSPEYEPPWYRSEAWNNAMDEIVYGIMLVALVGGIYSMRVMLKRKEFGGKWKYTLSLFLGMMIALVLASILTFISGIVLHWGHLEIALIVVFVPYIIGAILLGIVGVFIDKFHSKRS